MGQSLRSSTLKHSKYSLRSSRTAAAGLSLAMALLAGACENAAPLDDIDRVSMAAEETPSPLEGIGTKYKCSSARDTAAYEKAFRAAIQCRYGSQLIERVALVDGKLEIKYTPLGEKLLEKKEYGCFCGPGNGGIDTIPLDEVDKCCKRHDEQLWYLCQNLPARDGALPNIKNDGCDCYTKTPVPKCKEKDKTIYFEDLKKLDACQRACADDLAWISTDADSANAAAWAASGKIGRGSIWGTAPLMNMVL